MSANGALLAAPPMSPGPAPGRAERGPAGPAGQPMYKGGASDDNQKSQEGCEGPTKFSGELDMDRNRNEVHMNWNWYI